MCVESHLFNIQVSMPSYKKYTGAMAKSDGEKASAFADEMFTVKLSGENVDLLQKALSTDFSMTNCI